jgi:ABC-type dipeptide/oligopeptide/nickel transport system permease subunit
MMELTTAIVVAYALFLVGAVSGLLTGYYVGRRHTR